MTASVMSLIGAVLGIEGTMDSPHAISPSPLIFSAKPGETLPPSLP